MSKSQVIGLIEFEPQRPVAVPLARGAACGDSSAGGGDCNDLDATAWQLRAEVVRLHRREAPPAVVYADIHHLADQLEDELRQFLSRLVAARCVPG